MNDQDKINLEFVQSNIQDLNFHIKLLERDGKLNRLRVKKANELISTMSNAINLLYAGGIDEMS